MTSLEGWLLIGVISVLAGLDRTALASVMLSRPLVCAPLAGFVLGIFEPALQMGMMLELLWLMRLPVGAAVAPDDTQAAIGAVVLIKLFAYQLPDHQWAFMVFIALLVVVFAEIGKCFDVWARHINERLYLRALRHVESSSWNAMRLNHYAGLGVFACSSLLSFGFIVATGSAIFWAGTGYLQSFVSLFPVNEQLLIPIFPLVGVAATLVVLRVKHTIVLFLGGFALTYMLLEVL
jgi:PTS system mannose-specific IIC component